MITRDQALTAQFFHIEGHPAPSPRTPSFTWRRSGRTQTWKTRPADFRVPIKFGLGYSRADHAQITPYTASQYHTEEDCPYMPGPRSAETVKEGIERARKVLAGGDAAIAAYLLDEGES